MAVKFINNQSEDVFSTTKFLFRIYTLQRLSDFQNNKFIFVSPSKWTDPYEKAFLCAKYKGNENLYNHPLYTNLGYKVFAQCWTASKQSEAMRRVFAPDKNGVIVKMSLKMKKELFYKTTIKGVLAENEIAEFLNQYFADKKLKDRAYLTGNTVGVLPKNKTGDIICEVNGRPDLKIAIECKFDKSVRLGDIEGKDIFARKSDTAWSQLIEAQANRDSKVSLIVFDISLVENSILKNFENIGYIPGVGFVAIINSQKGNYSNLAIAYMLARDIALNSKEIELDKDILAMIVNRIIKDINEVLTIKSLVQNNIDNNKAILKQLEKSILLMEFNQEYLKRFLSQGTLTKKDLLDFYSGEDVKDKYRLIEKEINDI
ncbi:MAG: hypothetical protein ABIQ02_16620 [Saprospiraceae bacterium]